MRSKKVDFQYFNLTHTGNVLLKARCNAEYLKIQIEKIKEHELYETITDIEVLEEILIDENIEHYVLYPETITI